MHSEPMFRMNSPTVRHLGQSIGTPEFYEACLAFMADLVSYDGKWIAVYSRVARPRILKFELATTSIIPIDRDLVLSTYELGFYRFDPIFRYWQKGGEPGVVGMHEVPMRSPKENTYMTDFMPITQMADDVAVLLPVSNRECVSLELDRATTFSGEEFEILRSIYPLLAGMNESHLRAAAWKEATEETDGSSSPIDFGLAVNSFTAQGLTPRERDIVQLILGGYSNDAIAQRMGISVGTVKNHRKRLYAKLDITTEREIFTLFMAHLADVDPSELI